MNWQQLALDFANHAFGSGVAFGATLGLGGGAGFITLLHYWPPPFEDQPHYGAIWDAMQDRVKNVDRVGARRPRPEKVASQ